MMENTLSSAIVEEPVREKDKKKKVKKDKKTKESKKKGKKDKKGSNKKELMRPSAESMEVPDSPPSNEEMPTPFEPTSQDESCGGDSDTEMTTCSVSSRATAQPQLTDSSHLGDEYFDIQSEHCLMPLLPQANSYNRCIVLSIAHSGVKHIIDRVTKHY